jgi:hypothetical protein
MNCSVSFALARGFVGTFGSPLFDFFGAGTLAVSSFLLFLDAGLFLFGAVVVDSFLLGDFFRGEEEVTFLAGFAVDTAFVFFLPLEDSEDTSL